MSNELKWLLKEGGGCMFESSYISHDPPHTQSSVAIVQFACNDSAMPLLSFTPNGADLHC